MKTRRPRIRIRTVVLVLAASGMALWLLPDSAPRNQGRTLDEWLHAYEAGGSRSTARDAVLTLATQAGTTRVYERYAQQLIARNHPLVEQASFWLRTHSGNRWHHPVAQERRIDGQSFFELMGADAAPAAPRLLAVWLQAGRLGNQEIYLSRALDAISPGLGPFVPTLIRELATNRDREGRALAAHWLEFIRCRPELAVPALQQAMDEPDCAVACAAIQSLGSYGTNAAAALPRLRILAADPQSPPVPILGYPLRDAVKVAIAKIESPGAPAP